MATGHPPSSSGDDGSPEARSSRADTSPQLGARRLTRASAAWVATGVALVFLIMLIIFMLQNSKKTEVTFLGLAGTVPLGVALLVAAVGGGVVVGIAGVARVTQLRMNARQIRQDIPH